MDWALLLLIAGFLSLFSFLLDLKAEEDLRETLKDLFMGLTFIAWYWDRDILGALFAVTALVVYYPELKKRLVRRREG